MLGRRLAVKIAVRALLGCRDSALVPKCNFLLNDPRFQNPKIYTEVG